MRQLFTSSPYLPPPEPEPILKLMREHGVERFVKRGEIVKPLLDNHRLYLVEEGVCCYYGLNMAHPFIPFLLLPGRTLGDITTIGNRIYNLEWRAVTDTRILVVPPSVLTETVLDDPELARLKVQHLISKEESSLEGMSANFTLPPALRIKILLKELLKATGRMKDEGWMMLPYRIPAEVIGLVVNLTRANVSRTISDWIKHGLVRRVGQDIEVHYDLFEDLYDWLEACRSKGLNNLRDDLPRG